MASFNQFGLIAREKNAEHSVMTRFLCRSSPELLLLGFFFKFEIRSLPGPKR